MGFIQRHWKQYAHAVLLVFVALVILDLAWSIGSTCLAHQPNATQKHCSIDDSATYAATREFVHFVEHGEHFFVAFGTIVIAVFTIILGIATGLLSSATKALVRGAEDTAQRQLRAYLTSGGLKFEEVFREGATHYSCIHLFRNNANTPARHVINRINQNIVGQPYPEDFYLRDNGDPLPGMVISVGVVGPRGSLSTPIFMTAETMHLISSGSIEHYIWGWVEYDDAFAPQTPRRRTEYCFRIRADAAGKPTYVIHSDYNGMDEDCRRHASPR